MGSTGPEQATGVRLGRLLAAAACIALLCAPAAAVDPIGWWDQAAGIDPTTGIESISILQSGQGILSTTSPLSNQRVPTDAKQYRTTDFGRSWTPIASEPTITRVWQVAPGAAVALGRLSAAGSDPQQLLRWTVGSGKWAALDEARLTAGSEAINFLIEDVVVPTDTQNGAVFLHGVLVYMCDSGSEPYNCQGQAEQRVYRYNPVNNALTLLRTITGPANSFESTRTFIQKMAAKSNMRAYASFGGGGQVDEYNGNNAQAPWRTLRPAGRDNVMALAVVPNAAPPRLWVVTESVSESGLAGPHSIWVHNGATWVNKYTAPDNSQIHQLVAPGPAYAAALEVDPQQENGRFLEWAPALPKFRYITAVNPGDGQVQSLTPDFSILSAKGRVAAQSGAHALAAVFATDPEADLPNSELYVLLKKPDGKWRYTTVAPANSLSYYYGAQSDDARVHVIALAGARAVAAVGGMDAGANFGVRFLTYADQPATK